MSFETIKPINYNVNYINKIKKNIKHLDMKTKQVCLNFLFTCLCFYYKFVLFNEKYMYLFVN